MRHQAESPLLADLQRAQTTSAQVTALKHVKNLLVGHELRKVEWIGYGILPMLSEVLSTRRKRSGKQPRPGPRTAQLWGQESKTGDEDEAVLLQATGIVCIIAKGGSSFVEPILHSNILSQLVSVLSAEACSSRVAHGILRCLNAVADHLPPCAPTNWLPNQKLALLLYSGEHVGCWASIVAQHSSNSTSQQVCALAASLIWKTGTEEKHKRALVEAGILPALASALASHVVAQGLVLPVLDNSSLDQLAARDLPSPATPAARLAPILAAVALLLDGSKSRIEVFLASSPIMNVFPKAQSDKTQTQNLRKSPWVGQSASSWASSYPSKSQNPIDSLLPHLPIVSHHRSAEHNSFPPLGSTGSILCRQSPLLSRDPANHPNAGYVDDGMEIALVAWLIYMIRTQSGLCRVMAAKLLVILFKQGYTTKPRSSDCCNIVVPALVDLLARDPEALKRGLTTSALDCGLGPYNLVQQVPAVLAELVMDDLDLQKAAVDARAIKPLCMALKETFEFTSEAEVAMWWPDRATRLAQDKTSPTRRLGNVGPSLRFLHTMQYREVLLKALAALAAFNDEYRKAICEQGVLPLIIDSLKPMVLTATSSPGESSNFYPSNGNPAATLLAACSAIRALARSVSALRTTLIDAGVATPILKLLKNPDPEVRIAATRVVGNLAMDFSPMKETVGHSNVIKTLCEHAHSANPRLRYESVWSLKQLVVNSTNQLKMRVIQELGPSWMKQLISTDPIEIPPGVVIGLIDLDFPTKRPMYQEGDDVEMGDLGDAYGDTSRNSNQYTISADDPNQHTVEDDTAIQEQLLDLIRNLFCGSDAHEIIEYIFAEMGQKDFFDILIARLRPRIIPGHTRKENKSIQPPAGIVFKVMVIIVHMAASLSKYRNLVASNHNLMRQVLTYTTHPDSEIRAQCCWIAINLTYEDDPSDHAGCKHRAAELQKVSYFAKISPMANDVVLDIRERQKTACELIRQLLS
jgi:hypothetical protein